MALQGFGGVMAVIHRELVDRRRWLSTAEFAEEWAVAQLLPGPNVVNLMLMLGARWFGASGALAAMSGLLLAPLVVVLALAVLAARAPELGAVQGALRGMGAVAAGLIAATALRLAQAMRTDVLGRSAAWAAVACVFALVALLRVPLVVALLVVGPAMTGWAYWRMRHQPGARRP